MQPSSFSGLKFVTLSLRVRPFENIVGKGKNAIRVKMFIWWFDPLPNSPVLKASTENDTKK